MKNFFLLLFTFCTVSAFSATYPFADGYESYTNMAVLGTQGGYNSDMSIFPYGINNSQGLVAEMLSLGSASLSAVTPIIGPFTATSEFTIHYKILTQNATPAIYNLVAGDSVNVYINAGPTSILIGSINVSNQFANIDFQKWVIPGDPGAVGFSTTLKIVTKRAAGSNFVVDMDSLQVKDAAGGGLIITPTVNQITCNGLCNGAISVDVSGGAPLYSYAWVNGSTDQILMDLCPGTFGLTVTDANGVSGSISIDMVEPDFLSGTVTHVNATTSTATNGSVTITATGGTSPFTYSIDGGANIGTPNVFNALGVSCYTPFIRDANDCVALLDTVCVSSPNFVNNVEASVLAVYPNPAQNYIDVNTTLNVSTIEIYNSIGQMVMRKEMNKTNNRIDVSMLNCGSYFIRFNNNGNAIKHFSIIR